MHSLRGLYGKCIQIIGQYLAAKAVNELAVVVNHLLIVKPFAIWCTDVQPGLTRIVQFHAVKVQTGVVADDIIRILPVEARFDSRILFRCLAHLFRLCVYAKVAQRDKFNGITRQNILKQLEL